MRICDGIIYQAKQLKDAAIDIIPVLIERDDIPLRQLRNNRRF